MMDVLVCIETTESITIKERKEVERQREREREIERRKEKQKFRKL